MRDHDLEAACATTERSQRGERQPRGPEDRQIETAHDPGCERNRLDDVVATFERGMEVRREDLRAPPIGVGHHLQDLVHLL